MPAQLDPRGLLGSILRPMREHYNQKVLTGGVGVPKRGLQFHNQLEDINVGNLVVDSNEQVQLSVTPQILQENVGWVTVSWRNVDKPTSLDWIAV